jgi:hypothetical protein
MAIALPRLAQRQTIRSANATGFKTHYRKAQWVANQTGYDKPTPANNLRGVAPRAARSRPRFPTHSLDIPPGGCSKIPSARNTPSNGGRGGRNRRQNCHTPLRYHRGPLFLTWPGPARARGRARACAGAARERGQTTSTADHVNVLSFETQRADWIKASCSLSRNECGDPYYEFQH